MPTRARGWAVGGAQAMAAWSSTSSKDKILGSATGNSDLTVNLDTGAGGSSDAAAGDEDDAVGPESWWYYHLMMTVSSLYMAMLLTNWSMQPVDELEPDFPPVGKKATPHHCVSLCWSADGATLFSGYTDGHIRVWSVGIGR